MSLEQFASVKYDNKVFVNFTLAKPTTATIEAIKVLKGGIPLKLTNMSSTKKVTKELPRIKQSRWFGFPAN